MDAVWFQCSLKTFFLGVENILFPFGPDNGIMLLFHHHKYGHAVLLNLPRTFIVKAYLEYYVAIFNNLNYLL